VEAFVGIVVVVILIAVIRGVIAAATDRVQAARAVREVRKAIEKGLAVSCRDDVIHEKEGGRALSVVRVQVSGAIVVPRAPLAATLRVRIIDITDSTERPQPLFCVIPEMSDEDGLYRFDHAITIPYHCSEVANMPVTALPSFALVGPKKGSRRVRVVVAVTEAGTDDQVFAAGETTVTIKLDTTGYLEIAERTKAREKQIATLAIAVSGSDGHFDKRESAVIRRFFSERFAKCEDSSERRRGVTETLQQTLDQMQSGRASASELIAQLCAELASDDDEIVQQSAYELCVQVVAADEAVDPRESRCLKLVAEGLRLPREFVQATHERHLRLAMFDQIDDEQSIGMPAGMTREEKIEYLNGEYRKWRSRATHKDPKVAAEASVRLERITKLRGQLVDA